MPANSIKKQKKKKKEKSLQQSKGIQRDDRSSSKSVENEFPGKFKQRNLYLNSNYIHFACIEK